MGGGKEVRPASLLTKAQRAHVRSRLAAGASVRSLAGELGVSRLTVTRARALEAADA
jgi:hypothetical protein